MIAKSKSVTHDVSEPTGLLLLPRVGAPPCCLLAPPQSSSCARDEISLVSRPVSRLDLPGEVDVHCIEADEEAGVGLADEDGAAVVRRAPPWGYLGVPGGGRGSCHRISQANCIK